MRCEPAIEVPAGHKCGKMHGHRYEIRLEITGLVGATGWIVDFADVKQITDPVVMRLDHATLKEIEGLENPTCELIAVWLADNLTPQFPGLSRIEVRETSRAGVVWTRFS